jgi:RNA polymerase sigma factor (sigma-70 family)
VNLGVCSVIYMTHGANTETGNSKMSLTDAELYERWRAERDAEAFAELVIRHTGMVFGAAFRILRDSAQAEEIAQDCFLNLAATPTGARRSVGGWLHALAVCRALDRLRAGRSRRKREAQFAHLERARRDRDWEELQALVQEAIAELPLHLRDAVVCRYLEGLTLDETAKRLALARSTRPDLERRWRRGDLSMQREPGWHIPTGRH